MRLTQEFIKENNISEETIAKRKQVLDQLDKKAYENSVIELSEIYDEYHLDNTATHKDIIVILLSKYDRILHAIAYKQASKVVTICSADDVYQYAVLKILEKPEIIDCKYFFATFKNLCINATITEVRRYRKYKVTPMDATSFQMLNIKTKCTLPSYKGLEYDDFMNTLTDIEKRVFQLHFLQHYTKREVDEKLGQYCDRILNNVKKAYLLYKQHEFTTICLPVEETEKQYIDDSNIKPLKYTSKEHNKKVNKVLASNKDFSMAY